MCCSVCGGVRDGPPGGQRGWSRCGWTGSSGARAARTDMDRRLTSAMVCPFQVQFLSYYALVAGGQVTVLAPMVRPRGQRCGVRRLQRRCVSIAFSGDPPAQRSRFNSAPSAPRLRVRLVILHRELRSAMHCAASLPQVGLYSVIPVTVGLLFRGEDRTLAKLGGIALSFVAVGWPPPPPPLLAPLSPAAGRPHCASCAPGAPHSVRCRCSHWASAADSVPSALPPAPRWA